MKTYVRHRICNVIDIKELIALEILDFEGKYKNYVESHDFWEICYVVNGSITLLLGEKEMSLGENELILIPPNKKHSYLSHDGNDNKAFVVCFDSFSQILDAIGGNVFASDSVQVYCMDRIMAESLRTFHMNESDELEALPEACFGGQQALLLQLEYLLISLVRRMSLDANSAIVFFSDENFYGDLANAILRFFRENLHKKLTLGDVCNRFSYSRSFLCRIFKEQTGLTLISCLNDLKIDEAKRLLTGTTRSVTDIASSLGFGELKYFDALFKKHTGLSPMAYRQSDKNVQ